MRRVLTMVLTFMIALSSALPAYATSPHFMPSKITASLNGGTGVVTISYMVSGLGGRAQGTIRVRGWLTVSATCENGATKTIQRFTDKQDRVATKSGYAGPDGNWSGTIALSPAKVCPPGSNLTSVTYSWGTLTMWLWEGGSAGSTADAADTIQITV